MKILVVDDDLELLGLVGFALRQAGYAVVEATNGAEALETFQGEQPDLVILDVNLPGLNGFEVSQRLRSAALTPILMLTVRNTEEDHVHGLDQGADDFLTKPFSPRTLLAHVRALLRRSGTERPDRPEPLAAGDLQLVLENQAVMIGDGTLVHLTNREFRLLQYLLANAGRTIHSDQLTRHVWGYHGTGDRQLLKQIVHRLRQKIERDPAEPHYVVTVPGVGYKLQPTASEGA